MKIETINKLCCPFDKGDLGLTEITKDVNDNILEGFFVCSSCKRLYPIVRGIPIMSPDEYREFKLEQPLMEKWQKHFKGQKFENFRLTEPEQIEN
ncbi:trm112p-like protein [Arenibacter sp. NBRC 103722]|uniref:Trm112 family protein n=1 Tax=Arenibacter sp. NBRC 103722 TaxID=1113929 RepID=UPI000853618E|nr:Trm112 family protein [Arenibacter sp. NBRC 103722]GBF19141.1 trm112p-like protein [Arenibacter sp. NBRC 103722]